MASVKQVFIRNHLNPGYSQYLPEKHVFQTRGRHNGEHSQQTLGMAKSVCTIQHQHKLKYTSAVCIYSLLWI